MKTATRIVCAAGLIALLFASGCGDDSDIVWAENTLWTVTLKEGGEYYIDFGFAPNGSVFWRVGAPVAPQSREEDG